MSFRPAGEIFSSVKTRIGLAKTKTERQHDTNDKQALGQELGNGKRETLLCALPPHA